MKLFLDQSKGYLVKVNSGSAPQSISSTYLNDTNKDSADKNEAVLQAFADAADEYRFIWDNNGLDSDGKSWTVQDMYSTPDAAWMMPKVVSEIAIEAIEPMLLITGLMQKVAHTPGTTTLILPSLSAMSATNLNMAEGDEYPEAKFSTGKQGLMISNIGKKGIAVKITEEMLRYSQFDVIGMHIRAAGKCMARHKEVEAANMVAGQGTCYFDNVNPTQSVLGVTHGRNSNGSANGSMVVEDLLELEGHLIARGFVGNTLMLHPLTYTMFRKDPVMRHLFFNGQNTTYFGSYRGNAAGGNPWSYAKGGMTLGKQQKITKETPSKLRNESITSAPSFPGYWGVNFEILVTPYVKYNTQNDLTDFILCDKTELGVLLVDEELTTEEWADPARDIYKIKMRERYAFGILNEGQSVAVMRNIKNVPNKILDMPATPHYNTTVDLTEINPMNPIAF